MTPPSIQANRAPHEEPPFLSLYEDLPLLEKDLTRRVDALNSRISTLSEQGNDPATQFAVSVTLGKTKAAYFKTYGKLSVVRSRSANAAQLIVRQQRWKEEQTTAERMEARSRSRWNDLQQLSAKPAARSTEEASLFAHDPISSLSSFPEMVEPIHAPSMNPEERVQLDLDLARAFEKALGTASEEVSYEQNRPNGDFVDSTTDAAVPTGGLPRSPSMAQLSEEACSSNSEDLLPSSEPTPKPSSPPVLICEVKERPRL